MHNDAHTLPNPGCKDADTGYDNSGLNCSFQFRPVGKRKKDGVLKLHTNSPLVELVHFVEGTDKCPLKVQ